MHFLKRYFWREQFEECNEVVNLEMYFLSEQFKVFLRKHFWKCIFEKANFKLHFLEWQFFKTATLKMYFLTEKFLKIYFLREQFWKSLIKNDFFFYTLWNFLSFFSKTPLTFVCYSHSEKQSLKIRKVTNNTGSFIKFLK